MTRLKLIHASLLVFTSSSLFAADWPQFLGPTRNAVSPETGLLTFWPKDGPPQVWEKKVGEGYSAPVIVGDRLIVYHRVGNHDVVESLDAATGKPGWKFEYATSYEDDYGKGNGPRSTPAVAGGKVYTLSADGKMHCLELASGKKVWERSLSEDYQPKKGYFGVATSPLVEGDRVLVNVGGKGAGVVALDAATGKEVWKATDQAASYSSPIATTIDGSRYVIFFTRDGILGLDPANGKVRFQKRWRARIDASVNAAVPLVVDDLLFVSASYGTGAILHRVRKDSLEEVWKGNDIISNHYNTTVHHGGYLYGIDGREEGGAAELRCVELKTGKVRWSKPRFGCASLLVADSHLIALTETGDLVLIDLTPDGYKEKSRASVLSKPCRAELALANGRLYARDPQRLVCWNLKK
jgi:outer membrane protein assembly factor BamB